MVDSLKTFNEGDKIFASETNSNNQYLLSKLSDNAAQVQTYVEGEISSIQSNVASVQATLQFNIDELKELVNEKVYLVERVTDGSYWRRVWSDGWCEQGDITRVGDDRSIQVVLKKPYKDMDYHAQATLRGAFSTLSDAGVGAYPASATSLYLRNGSGSAINICWETKGYVEIK